MSQYLTNIGKVETAGAASLGNVSIVNSAGWIVSVSNTGGSVILADGTAVAGTMYTIAIGGGSLVSVANTGGQVGLYSGTGLIGSANIFGTISMLNTAGIAVNVINTAGLVVNVSNTGGSQILAQGTALIGSANVIAYGGFVNIVNTAGIAVNIINTAGLAINVINTSSTVDTHAETMFMTSGAVNVYSYSTGIECSATNNLIIAASANRIFKIIAYDLMAQVANNARFQSGSDGTDFKTGTMFIGGSGGKVNPYNPMGWFSVTAGSPLYLKLATANSVGGVVSYLVM